MPSMSTGAITTEFRGYAVAEKVASYVAVAADFGGGVLITMNSGSATTLTVNTGLVVSRPLAVLNEGAGLCTLTAGAGVTFKSAGAKLRLTEQYSMASIIPDPLNADTYWIVGALS